MTQLEKSPFHSGLVLAEAYLYHQQAWAAQTPKTVLLAWTLNRIALPILNLESEQVIHVSNRGVSDL